MKYLIFKIEDRKYGIESHKVKEVIKDSVEDSVYNLRELIVPIVDFSKLIDNPSPTTHILHILDGDSHVGLAVGKVLDFVEKEPSDIPGLGTNIWKTIINDDGVVCILDTNILNMQKLKESNKEEQNTKEESFLGFCLGDCLYAIETSKVDSIQSVNDCDKEELATGIIFKKKNLILNEKAEGSVGVLVHNKCILVDQIPYFFKAEPKTEHTSVGVDGTLYYKDRIYSIINIEEFEWNKV